MATKRSNTPAAAGRTSKAAPPARTTSALAELGRSGLKQSFGYIQDESLPELRDGVRRTKLYREIRDNSPVVGGAFRAIDNILLGVPVRVEPGGDAPEDLRAWELIDSAFHDMETPWRRILAQSGSMKEHGWSALEPIYKRRGGDVRDPARRSQFTDGLVGWRKFAPRAQESLERWQFAAGTDDVEALIQRPAPDYREIIIPREKLLLFAIEDSKGSPEGRSLLRNCIIAWKFVKRIQEIEGIGIERDLAGLPVIYAPLEVLATTAVGNELAVQQYLKKLVTNIRRDAQEGVLMPSVTDAQGKRQYELTLLSSAGTRQFDTDKVIQRYEQRILLTFLADFLTLGSQATGSYALSQDKTDLFTQSLAFYLDSTLEPLNREEIPRLMAMNGMRAKPPRFTHGAIGKRDLGILGQFLAQLATAGLLLPSVDGQLEAFLLQSADLPVPKDTIAEDGDVKKRHGWEEAIDALMGTAA